MERSASKNMQDMEQYYDDFKKLYAEKDVTDIYPIFEFERKYYGKLELEHIPSLLRLLYGYSTLPEQNETIVDMLGTIVKRYGQAAVNAIVENSYILIEEKSKSELYIIIVMIVFWNEEMKLDIVTPLKAAEEPVKDMYIECMKKRLNRIDKSGTAVFQDILDRLAEA